MKISVIVSTYNSPAWLRKVLWGYSCQSDRDFEIVVADDGSGEETGELLQSAAQSYPVPLRRVWHEDDGFRKWRIVNRAIEAAHGEYLLFTDGDCIPPADLVATHRRLARPGRFLSGSYLKLPMDTSEAVTQDDVVSQRCFSLAWLSRHGYGPHPNWLKIIARPLRIDAVLNALTPAKRTFNGNNSSCWRADAVRIGGFDERIRYGGGDREFGYRLVHAGVRPMLVRYSAPCLHLDHARGYRNAAVRALNESIIAETRASRRVRTEHGLPAPEAGSR